MARTKSNLVERIKQLEFELFELKEQYATQLYFETMPEYDPVYKYCYASSNRSIPYPLQSMDAWLRAVMKHMASRSTGHGGANTSAILVSVPIGLSDKGVEFWLNLTIEKLRREAKRYGRRTD
jgi:hypothetical protein